MAFKTVRRKMTESADDPPLKDALTDWEFLTLHKTMIEKLFEFAIRDIDTDLNSSHEKSIIERIKVRAYWKRWVEVYLKFSRRMEEYGSPQKRRQLVLETFGEQVCVPSSILKPDIDRRLAWFKTRVANDFEREVLHAYDHHLVKSPIEQIFLMQWQFQKHQGGIKYELLPQKVIEVGETKYAVDFVVTRPQRQLRLGVELDGHEFHEKSKLQVARDKRRERAIVTRGYHILRFSGYEVYQDVASVVEEVLQCADNLTDG